MTTLNNSSLLDNIYNLTDEYIKSHNKENRKAKGQFFTSRKSVSFMAAMIASNHEHVSILDPGAGNGSLSSAAVWEAVRRGAKSISLDMVEPDTEIQDLLSEVKATIEEFCRINGVSITVRIIKENFITWDCQNSYDIVISNPPYMKLRKNSEEAITMEKYVYGQPNLYALFMAKGLDLLKSGGSFVYIVPRSWTSGAYFKRIREHVFSNLDIRRIHIFDNRQKAFDGEDVLQETMIISGIKDNEQEDTIQISVSSDDSYSDISIIKAASKDIINVGPDKLLLIPASEEEKSVLEKMSQMKNTFESLGYIFKTGPVVEFRNKEFISDNKSTGFVPMFRSANITPEGFVFPVHIGKAQYISEKASSLLLPNTNTVLVKRISSKEETKRLQSCIYCVRGDNEYISIENHVNYLVRKDGKKLTQKEIEWVQSILSSELYNTYFRIINGSTQVNAGDLNRLPVNPF